MIAEGELKQERWEKDGQKHSRVVVIASQIYTHAWVKHIASGAKPPDNPVDFSSESEVVPF